MMDSFELTHCYPSDHAIEARSSPVPENFAAVPLCQPRPGLVQATSATDNSFIGFVRNAVSGNGTFGLTPNRDEALLVQANCDGQFFDLNTIVRTAHFRLILSAPRQLN